MSDIEIKSVSINTDDVIDEVPDMTMITIHDHPDERDVDKFLEESIDEKDSINEITLMRRLVQPRLLNIGLMQELAISRGGKCISPDYVGFSGHLEWECCDGHRWKATPRNVSYYQSWCPRCRGNVGEELVRSTMIECFPKKKFERIRPEWLNKLELDGYDHDLKLAFEYQGIQHFKYVPHFHREDGRFESQLARDAYKRECCTRMGINLLEIPYTIKLDQVRSVVRKMLFDSGFAIADISMSDNDFYNLSRANSHYNEARLNLAKEIANAKGGVCLATKYIRNDFKMDFICKDGHSFQASLQDINQPLDRGPRFCPICGGTQKKNDDTIRARVGAIKYRLISIDKKFVGGKNRCWLTVQCPENHYPYEVSMDNLISRDGSLNKGCNECGHMKTGKSKLSDISQWSEKTGFTIIGEYIGGNKVSTWKCPLGHEFEATFVALKVRKHRCRICLLTQR